MSGAVWAAFSGLGFGVFQTLNRRTVLTLDVYVSTFVQLLAGVVLLAACVATGDLRGLGSATAAGLAWFAAAGVIHFFGGWTFPSMSQRRIGAARTSPLVCALSGCAGGAGTSLSAGSAESTPATAPVFGVAVAATTLRERPSPVSLAGIMVVLALGLLSVPVVVALSPLVLGRVLERITPRVLAGSTLVVGGALLLVTQ